MPQSELPLEISVSDVAALREQEEPFLLLDCREPHEYETAAIDGSLLIPMSELGARVNELDGRRDDRIIVHCHHGGRSQRVTMWLRQQGYDRVQNMSGGIDAWSQIVDSSLPRY